MAELRWRRPEAGWYQLLADNTPTGYEVKRTANYGAGMESYPWRLITPGSTYHNRLFGTHVRLNEAKTEAEQAWANEKTGLGRERP